ncbi:MAG: metalloregulator ArsR/SmtB family transcription factor [Candidatus Bathyarchaeota archaeon]|nr:metalloregulator ArsR/SmtB family transcription factor [Candidatus Bathyarchaeota archaeon]
MKHDLNDYCYLFFSTFSNPTRLGIVEQLREGPKNVTQLSEVLNQEQSMISHNLKPLIRCHFVLVEKKWREHVYSLNEETMRPLFKIIDSHVEKYCPMKGKCKR